MTNIIEYTDNNFELEHIGKYERAEFKFNNKVGNINE